MTFAEPRDFLDEMVRVKIDRPMGSKHPHVGFVYPVNYGFLPGVPAPDGEMLDAYVLGPDGPVDEFQGRCIAVIHRINDADDKLVVVPEGQELSDEEILSLTQFAEHLFQSVIIRHKADNTL